MNAAAVLALIGPLSEAIRGIIHEIQLLHEQGEITAEQLAEVKRRAAISDAHWDAMVSTGKSRPPGLG